MTMATDDIADALDDLERSLISWFGPLTAEPYVVRIRDARTALTEHAADDKRIEEENAELHRRIEAIEDASGESFEDAWVRFMAARRAA